MDNLTHSLVGLALSRAGLERHAPHAALLCVIAANAPDLDLLAGLDPEVYLIYHRHLSHSLLALPLMAAVSVLLTLALVRLTRLLRRRQGPASRFPWLRMGLVALLPAASHPLLDLTNSYGVRLWLPFSGAWASADLLFIIDLVVWAILIAAAVAPLAAPRWLTNRRAAWAGLAALVLYLAFSAALRHRIVDRLAQLQIEGSSPQAVAAFPAPYQPFSWSGYLRTAESEVWLPIDATRLDQLDPSDGLIFERDDFNPDERRALAAVSGAPLERAYRQFAQYPLSLVEPGAKGPQVTLADFRFMHGGEPRLACRFQLDQALTLINAQFDW